MIKTVEMDAQLSKVYTSAMNLMVATARPVGERCDSKSYSAQLFKKSPETMPLKIVPQEMCG
jgi:hypothetical protein